MAQETTATAPEVKETVKRTVVINRQPWVVEFGSRKAKGEEVQLPFGIIQFPTDRIEGLQRMIEAVGLPKFLAALYRDFIRPACLEASSEAWDDEKGFNEGKYVEAFLDQFEPTSRSKGGPKLKDILTRMSEIGAELASVVVAFQTETDATKKDAQRMKLARLTTEMNQLGLVKEKKSRLGRKKAAPKAATA